MKAPALLFHFAWQVTTVSYKLQNMINLVAQLRLLHRVPTPQQTTCVFAAHHTQQAADLCLEASWQPSDALVLRC